MKALLTSFENPNNAFLTTEGTRIIHESLPLLTKDLKKRVLAVAYVDKNKSTHWLVRSVSIKEPYFDTEEQLNQAVAQVYRSVPLKDYPPTSLIKSLLLGYVSHFKGFFSNSVEPTPENYLTILDLIMRAYAQYRIVVATFHEKDDGTVELTHLAGQIYTPRDTK